MMQLNRVFQIKMKSIHATASTSKQLLPWTTTSTLLCRSSVLLHHRYCRKVVQVLSHVLTYPAVGLYWHGGCGCCCWAGITWQGCFELPLHLRADLQQQQQQMSMGQQARALRSGITSAILVTQNPSKNVIFESENKKKPA